MSIRILIASAGRRNYLVEWFKFAITSEKIKGQVIVGDADPEAPARYSADDFIQLPPLEAPDYDEKLRRACTDFDIDLALSLNDYENSLWAELGLSKHEGKTKFLCLSMSAQRTLEDKLASYEILKDCNINVPLTATASAVLKGSYNASDFGQKAVIKNRFGSGSYGLRITSADRLLEDLSTGLQRVKDHRGRVVATREEAAEFLVVQQHVVGDEYGMDVINDFSGNFTGHLVRKKCGMRDGETSTGRSVEPSTFRGVASAIAAHTKHKGLIDTDVIRDANGVDWVIDINPRFGGGYPFNHFAGADVPRLYLQWLQGMSGDPAELLAYSADVLAHKTISIVGDTKAK